MRRSIPDLPGGSLRTARSPKARQPDERRWPAVTGLKRLPPLRPLGPRSPQRRARPPPPARLVPTVQAVPPGPPQKNLTGAEFSQIHVGSSEKEVLTVLGPASSKVVVPDDDGHMRETLQYWVKGVPMGTVRLDNGHVVQIETKQK